MGRNLRFAFITVHITIWELPKIRGPYNKDPTMLGTIIGSPIFGNPRKGIIVLATNGVRCVVI